MQKSMNVFHPEQPHFCRCLLGADTSDADNAMTQSSLNSVGKEIKVRNLVRLVNLACLALVEPSQPSAEPVTSRARLPLPAPISIHPAESQILPVSRQAPGAHYGNRALRFRCEFPL